MNLKTETGKHWNKVFFQDASKGKPFTLPSPLPRIMPGEVQMILTAEKVDDREFVMYWRGIRLCTVAVYIMNNGIHLELA